MFYKSMLARTQTRWRRQFFCSSACAAAERLSSFLFYYVYTQFEIKHVVNFESLSPEHVALLSVGVLGVFWSRPAERLWI